MINNKLNIIFIENNYRCIFNPQKDGADTLEGYMAEWYIENFTLLYR